MGGRTGKAAGGDVRTLAPNPDKGGVATTTTKGSEEDDNDNEGSEDDDNDH